MTVIIFDAETRSALGALRALRAEGISVVAASYKKNALSFYSNACTDKMVYPNPGVDRDGFIQHMSVYLREHPQSLCMSFTDITTDAFQYGVNAKRIEPGVVFSPPWHEYERATNKGILSDIARQEGIPSPEIIPCTKEGLVEIGSIQFPIIVKPVRSVAWNGARAYKDTAHVVHTKEELASVVSMFVVKTGQLPLVQKMIYGDEFGVSVLAQNGKIVALFAHKRLRSISRYGGVSTLRESVLLTPEMHSIAERLTRVLNWHGVMMIELKRNNETNMLTLIEINARFWGSLFLAIKSGADFPSQLYRLHSRELSEGSSHEYMVGIQARHMITDLSYFYSIGWSAFLPRNIITFCTFFKKGLYYDVLSWKDPLPGIIEFLQFIRKKL